MPRRVLCAGTFDHLHPGHIDFLRQAKALGDELIVIVARDETVLRLKGFYPTHNEELRRKNIENVKIADAVILGNKTPDILKIIEEIKPDIIALGYDQRIKESEIFERFPNIEIKRLKPFFADKFKSSFYRL